MPFKLRRWQGVDSFTVYTAYYRKRFKYFARIVHGAPINSSRDPDTRQKTSSLQRHDETTTPLWWTIQLPFLRPDQPFVSATLLRGRFLDFHTWLATPLSSKRSTRRYGPDSNGAMNMNHALIKRVSGHAGTIHHDACHLPRRHAVWKGRSHAKRAQQINTAPPSQQH